MIGRNAVAKERFDDRTEKMKVQVFDMQADALGATSKCTILMGAGSVSMHLQILILRRYVLASDCIPPLLEAPRAAG
ncbi:MAG: hypothetical protein LBU32_16125 [Clostridiales bacterium]|jgi:hypothetical protein|nr:hypothetical protein [Clostridiales bacterium]